MSIKNPHVTVVVDISGCAYDVRINDVPLIRDVDGYPVRVEIPVNHWICSGKNVLSVQLAEHWKQDEPPCWPACAVTLQVRDAHARPMTSVPLTSLLHEGPLHAAAPQPEPPTRADYPGLGAAEIGPVTETVEGRGRSLHRNVELWLPFPRWSWFDGEVHPYAADIKAALIPIYTTIWHALKEGRPRSILPLFYERTQELAMAFYMSHAEMEHVLTLEASVANADLELYPLDDAPVLEINGEGKLARLVDRDGEPLIGFAYKDGSASEYYEMFLCKRGGQWRISR